MPRLSLLFCDSEGIIRISILERHDPEGPEPRENDFHDLIEHGRHALSIDDDRKTFHPLLWLEDDFENGERAQANGCKSTIQQVWFAGVHSNVGGPR